MLRKLAISVWLFLIGRYLLRSHFWTFDQTVLVQGARSLLQCWETGSPEICGGVGPFPLFQYAFAVLGLSLGWSESAVLILFSCLSKISFCFLVFLGWRTLRASKGAGPSTVFLLAMLVGPLVLFAKSTANEVTAAAITLAAVIAVARSWSSFSVFALFFFSCLTKEIAWPFMLALAILSNPKTAFSKFPRWSALIGIFAGIVLNGLFNYYRFGSWFNLTYNDASQRVDLYPQGISQFVALWISPNLGWLLYWPAAAVPIIVLSLRQAHRNRVRSLSYFALIAVFLLGIAQFYSPSGGITWPPRLLLPWIPAVLWSLLYISDASVLTSLGQKLFQSPATFLVVYVFLVITSLPQIAIQFQEQFVYRFHSRINPMECRVDDLPRVRPLLYRCTNKFLWHSPSMLTAVMSEKKESLFWWHAFATLLGIAAFMRKPKKSNSEYG